MKTIVVCGAMWGDEGKGKLISYLSQHADITMRCNGGSNARHRITYNGKVIVLSLIPAGIFNSKLSIITGNVIINCTSLKQDLETCKKLIGPLNNKLFISKNCHIAFPHHISLNKASHSHIGTSGEGVGPANASRLMREGISLKRYFNSLSNDLPSLSDSDKELLNSLKEYLADVSEVVYDASQKNKNLTILLEGAQGFLLDNLHGTYPYVTSSATSTAGLLHGSGLPTSTLSRNIGVCGAYLTRAIHEPLITRVSEKEQIILQKYGNEYIALFDRWRDCFWLDLVALQYSHLINNFTELCINKLDVLSHLDELYLCVGYKHKGKIFNRIFDYNDFHETDFEPVYKKFKGWKVDIQGIKEWHDLPIDAQNYIKFIEDYIGTPVTLIGTGPHPEDIINRY